MLHCTGRALGAGVDLKEFDIDNKYGKNALERTIGIIIGSHASIDTVQACLPSLVPVLTSCFHCS